MEFSDLLTMNAWHALGIEDTRIALGKTPYNGGPNRLRAPSSMRWHIMLGRQFKSLLVLILILAAILSFLVGDKIDALAILSIIILNALLGFIQEWKAETALQNLKKMLSPRCRVIRHGVEQEIDAETLIPGDRVFLSTGNAVPADLRLTAAINLRIDESSLTGESSAVSKNTDSLSEDTPVSLRSNIAFMGTNVTNGHGDGLVVATGMMTEFGKIANLTEGIQETQTSLQKHLSILAQQLGIMALMVSAAVFIIGMIGGRDVVQMAMTGISLAVAAVPEGLPAVVTITLAIGMSTMARKKALLRHLQAAETLGAVSVICTDKTGTLTRNEMTVQRIWLPDGEIEVGGPGYETRGEFIKDSHLIEPQLHQGLIAFLDTGRKCNHARITCESGVWRATGSPTEAALIVVAEKAGLKQDHQGVIVEEHSFNSDRKRMSIIEETEDGLIAHVKGAPESLLPLCTHYQAHDKIETFTQEMRERVEQVCMKFSSSGQRTLALARKIIPKDSSTTQEMTEEGLVFLGIAGVIDPPRPEVYEALAKAKTAGIRVIMITGDSAGTGLAIAAQIGLAVTRAVTGTDLKALSDEDLSELLKEDILFARTVPEDKFRIVTMLQAQNRLVAMTGDGVNDAPALKQADIGIAMGIRGTDVAKGAADIVLVDDNFATIIAAIEEGRRQYTNIRKFVHFLVSHSIGEVSAVLLNIIIGGPLILLPIQILWINLATDSVTALALSIEKAEKNIMNAPPRLIDKPLIDAKSMLFLGTLGLYAGIATLCLFHAYLPQSHALANSVAFTTIVITAQVLVLNFRHLHGPVSDIGWFSNPWILTAIFAMFLMQAAALYIPALQQILHTVPLSVHNWLIIGIVSLPLFAVPEAYKYIKKRTP